MDRDAFVAILASDGPREALDRARQARLSLDEMSFSGMELRAVDWSDLSLRGADFRDSDLRKCSFRNTILQGATLDRCDLRQCDFDLATLAGASLQHAKLDEANWSAMDLRGADLRNASLRHAYLSYARIGDVRWDGCDLSGADLRGIGAAEGTWDACAFDEHTKWPDGYVPARSPAAQRDLSTIKSTSLQRAELSQVSKKDLLLHFLAKGTLSLETWSQALSMLRVVHAWCINELELFAQPGEVAEPISWGKDVCATWRLQWSSDSVAGRIRRRDWLLDRGVSALGSVPVGRVVALTTRDGAPESGMLGFEVFWPMRTRSAMLALLGNSEKINSQTPLVGDADLAFAQLATWWNEPSVPVSIAFRVS